MKSFFKLFLLIVVTVLSNSTLLAQYEWEKYSSNPLAIHGSSGSWDESVVTPCVIFNPDLNRYEMWFGTFDGTYPNNGIGFAWSTDGITWTKHPTAVMTPSGAGWDAVSVGECSVIKEGNVYKMWYTGHPNSTRTPSYIGYATSTDGGFTWEKHSGNPVLSPGTGWESARVEFPSVIKVTGGYWMFYTGELSHGIARTGRAFSTDGISWQKDTAHNPVLLPGGAGEWDQNNYLGNVIELDNTLYIYYTGETNPGVSGSAIGGASSTDMGITWTKFQNNPIIQRGTSGQWDNGWIETGCAVFAHNELKLYYDGGGSATGYLGRIGLAISDPLPAGTYTIGTGGNFATIQEAFDKLSTDGIAGEVGLVLIDSLYTAPSDAFGFKLVGPISGAGPSSRINLTNNHINRIEGDGGAVLTFDNMSYLTLYRGIMSSFTIRAISNNAFSSNDAINFIGNSDQNIVSRLFIENEDYQRGGIGISFKATDAQNAPDSNLIEDNFINKAGYAIVIAGYSQYGSTRPTGNVISRNMIGSETDSLIAWGIQSQRSKQTIIKNNVVQNVRNYFNFVCPGINAFGDIESIIRNNVVHNIYESSGTEYGVHGISLTGSLVWMGANNLVYNNMVYDIRSTAPQTEKEIAGIKIWCQTNPGIYFNTVNLEGTGPGYNGSAALYVRQNCTNVNVKNNVFINRRNDSPKCASAIFAYSGSTVSADYNDLFYDPSQYNCLVRADNVDYLTLQDWQGTGNDLHSYAEMPPFISSTDLHIDETIETYLESRGIPITGIESDFDGDVRNTSTPDIGADEFDGIMVGVEDQENLPAEFALEQNYPNPFNPSTTFRYSIPTQSKVIIKVFDILGNEVSTLMDEEKSVGTYELKWNAVNLPSGIYFYQIQAGSYVNTKKMILLK